MSPEEMSSGGISLEGVDDVYPLSPIQQGMLFDSLSNPDEDVYTAYVSVKIEGRIDEERLKSAWLATIARHQALRCEFHWEGLDEPLQIVRSTVTPEWVVENCSNEEWANEQWPNEYHKVKYPTEKKQPLNAQSSYRLLASRIIQWERQHKIDIHTAPLYRFVLLRVSESFSVLIWVVHHLIADGLSTPTILADVLAAYGDGGLQIAQAPYQYADYIQWLNEQNHDQAGAYWRNYLDAATPTPLKLARPSSDGLTGGKPPQTSPEAPTESEPKTLNEPEIIHQVLRDLNADQTRRIHAFCRDHKITLSTFIHGAWALVLREYSTKDMVLFVTTVSGRHPNVTGMDSAVGLYLNALPRSIQTSVHGNLVDWLQEIQQSIIDASRYDYSSLRDIQKLIPNDDELNLFDSIVTIGGHDSVLDIDANLANIQFSDIHYQSTQSHYDLALLVFPGEALEYSLVYNHRRFSEPDMNAVCDFFSEVMAQMLISADQTPPDVVAEIHPKQPDVPKKTTPALPDALTMHQWISSVAKNNPTTTAVVCGDDTVSYRVLDELSNRIAQMIHQRSPGRSQRIGLLIDRSILQIAGLLGILKSGNSYIPIDPATPDNRVAAMLEAAEAVTLLTSGRQADRFAGRKDLIIVEQNDQYSGDELTQSVQQSYGDQVAYVMFTSGSTGQPKGVQITHSNLIYSTAARFDYYGDAAPVFLLLSSIAFDSSVAGIYWSLCSGGTLVLPLPDQEKDIDSIAELISTSGITHTLCLPAYYELLLKSADQSLLSSLNTVVVAGEVLTPAVAKQHINRAGNTTLINEYGPTEACVWASAHEVVSPLEPNIPVGLPIAGTDITILNSKGYPCPAGVEGEIHISGPGVSPGYVNLSSETGKRFIESNFAQNGRFYRTGDLGYLSHVGELVFTGRADRQLKIRGYRIEPGEIESVLNGHAQVKQSLVVAQKALMIDRDGVPTSSEARREMIALLMANHSEEELSQTIDQLACEAAQTS